MDTFDSDILTMLYDLYAKRTKLHSDMVNAQFVFDRSKYDHLSIMHDKVQFQIDLLERLFSNYCSKTLG